MTAAGSTRVSVSAATDRRRRARRDRGPHAARARPAGAVRRAGSDAHVDRARSSPSGGSSPTWPSRSSPTAAPTSSPWVASCWPTPICPAKLAAGALDQVRPCIYQYRCIGNIFLGRARGLRGQRATAHGDVELHPPPIPAGSWSWAAGRPACEAARLLADRGHARRAGRCRSTARRDPRGGRAPPTRCWPSSSAWMVAEVERRPVDLRLSTLVSHARRSTSSASTRSWSPPGAAGSCRRSPSPPAAGCRPVDGRSRPGSKPTTDRSSATSSSSGATRRGCRSPASAPVARPPRHRARARATCSAPSSGRPGGSAWCTTIEQAGVTPGDRGRARVDRPRPGDVADR